MTKKNQSPFLSALVLADSEGVAAVDRTTLRAHGIRHVRVLSSGEEAARLLAREAARREKTRTALHAGRGQEETGRARETRGTRGIGEAREAREARETGGARTAPPACDVVLCNATLDDMEGTAFLRLIRKHPALASLPVILTAPQTTREDVLKAIGAGCSGFLVRPYTTAAFAEQLELAARSAAMPDMAKLMYSADTALSAEEFDNALATLGKVVTVAKPKAQECYEQGMAHLEARDYAAAIAAFNRAVRLNVLYAEAYMGLSHAWRGKGDQRKARKYMMMAGEAYARLEAFADARSVFSQLSQEWPDMPNLLLGTAGALVRQGNYRAAAMAYVEGYKLTPDADISTQVARACHFTDKPEEAAVALCRAMEKGGERDMAQRLYRRIIAIPERRPAPARKPLLAQFPMLNELVAVARYTMRAYKDGHAAPPEQLPQDRRLRII